MTTKEAIRHLETYSSTNGSGQTTDRQHEEAKKMAIEALEAEQWIPCSERVPEKSGQYYVSGGDKVWICEFLIIPNFTGGWCNDVANPVVQAWMPLPEPYKAERQEG